MRSLALLLATALLATPAFAESRAILVQSTTSTANSGLYDHILPRFEAETGFEVNVVAVGTGQAIRNAENCDGDILIVHAKDAEEAFVVNGFGTSRDDLMYNDFVIVGPSDDPAKLAGSTGASDALAKIAETGSLFASRGDESGTHKKELALWSLAGTDPTGASGAWYRETGSGMGATLNTGIGMGAYVLTDRATWIAFGNKQDYSIVVEGDPALFNQYGIIPVDPTHCPNVDAEAASTFRNWLLSEAGQSAIAEFTIDGQQLFFPNPPDD